MSGILSGPKTPPTPKIVTDPPGRDEAAETARLQRLRAAQSKGRQQTILGGGVGNEITGKTLLGG